MSEQQLVESYSWTMNWTCPVCKHYHTKPHFAFPKQLDKKIAPSVVGRIRDKFTREGKGNEINCEQYIEKYGTGPVENKKTKKQNPLFCPHCGWQDELIYITKK